MMCVWLLMLGCLATSALTTAYPVYGPKRFRTFSPLTLPIYNSHTSRPYYYDPYTQDLPEVVDVYPQDPYDRYRFYQVPYYFPETAPYYYDDEEMPEEATDEKVEEPLAQDWYNQDENAKANAYFLQNLIMAQMYKDAANRFPVAYGYSNPRDDYEEYVYGEPVKEVKEDDDVSQLKSLVKDSPKRQQAKNKQNQQPVFPDNTWTEKRSEKGQDEVVMPRPAIPRQVTFHQRVHEPSAYDAIKKLLQVQSQHKKRNSESRQPQKRSYIPNEDALVEQLDNLKKSA